MMPMKFKVGDIVTPKKGRIRSNNYMIKDIIKLKVERVNEGNGWSSVNYDLLQCKVLKTREGSGYRWANVHIYSNSVEYISMKDNYSVF